MSTIYRQIKCESHPSKNNLSPLLPFLLTKNQNDDRIDAQENYSVRLFFVESPYFLYSCHPKKNVQIQTSPKLEKVARSKNLTLD